MLNKPLRLFGVGAAVEFEALLALAFAELDRVIEIMGAFLRGFRLIGTDPVEAIITG